jgi:hypothetical protein
MVECANPREPGNRRENRVHSVLEFGAPNVGVVSATRLQNYRRAAGPTALEKHVSPSADVDETGNITGSWD